MPETPLPSPSSVPYRVQQRESYLTAYNLLLRLEGTILVEIKHATVTKDKSQREDDLMYCRIVGHFFHHVASYTGLSNLVLEVSSTDRLKFLGIGKLCYDHALWLCEFILSIFSLRVDKTPVRFAKRTYPCKISPSFSPVI